jgi:hypothetical protein
VDEAETEAEGRCVGAEEGAEEDEPVRWCGRWAADVRDGLGVLALALEDPLPVRVRVASGAGGVVEEPLRARAVPW